MFTLFSHRTENGYIQPDVYEYQNFSKSFRMQVFYIVEQVMDAYNNWSKPFSLYAREKGVDYDKYQSIELTVKSYILECRDTDLLDFTDFFFWMFDAIFRDSLLKNNTEDRDTIVDNAINELNNRFRQNGLGFEFINGKVIRKDNEVIHQGVVKPVLKLLYSKDFEGAEQEYLKAFEFRRNGDNKNAIIEAAKAFESTMKTICEKMKYEYRPTKDNASDLIKILKTETFFPSYMNPHVDQVVKSLETGLPVTRNKLAGHGQGIEPIKISDEFVDYALNLAATNMLLLIKIYLTKCPE